MPYDPFAGAISTLADAQAYQRERLALIAAEHETAGIVADALITPTPGSPEVFATDADSVSRLREVVWLLEAGTIASAQWASESGTWYTLEPAGTSLFAMRLAAACVAYAQACRDNHQALDDDIEAAASASACLAIDLSAGWPSRSVAVPTPLPTRRYVVAWWIAGKPEASELFGHVAGVAFTLPVDLAGSQVKADTAATASAAFDLRKNGSSVGTLTIAASGTTATFTAASAVQFAAGDRIDLVAPSSQDATLANVRVTLMGWC